MVDYTIAEEYTLPSKGKVYSVKINPVVKLRSMTTQDEMKRLSPSTRPYKNICELIDSCIVSEMGISAYDLCLADYQFLLHKLRIVTYGTEYNMITKCPFCTFEKETKFDLSTLKVEEWADDTFTQLLSFKLPYTQHNIELNLQTPRMMDDIKERNDEILKRSKGMSVDNTLLLTVANMIRTVDGEALDPVKKEELARSLPMMDTNYIIKHAQKLVESFGIDTAIEVSCPTCGLNYTTFFRVTAEFFGPSVDF